MSNYLVLSHLNVKNANALSSPISIGVPSVTAFLGATHKLQRHLNINGFDSVKVKGTGIVIHEAQLRTFENFYKENSLVASRQPLKYDKKICLWSSPPYIPDPKINLVVSLICDIEDDDFAIYDEKAFLKNVDKALSTEIRIAGGEILSPRVKGGKTVSSFLEAGRINYFPGKDAQNPSNLRDIKRLLTPGYVLIERREILEQEMEKGKDPVEAIIDYLAVHHECKKTDKETIEWTRRKRTVGWLVPISVGFQGLTEPEKVKNQRDDNYLHVFGENLITLGEYRIINSIKDFGEIIWRYKTDLDKQLYSCTCNGGN